MPAVVPQLGQRKCGAAIPIAITISRSRDRRFDAVDRAPILSNKVRIPGAATGSFRVCVKPGFEWEVLPASPVSKILTVPKAEPTLTMEAPSKSGTVETIHGSLPSVVAAPPLRIVTLYRLLPVARLRGMACAKDRDRIARPAGTRTGAGHGSRQGHHRRSRRGILSSSMMDLSGAVGAPVVMTAE
jgi:hypothetical protein